MGISYSNKEKKLNLNQYAKLVNKFVKNKKTKIIFEPGRFIIRKYFYFSFKNYLYKKK